MKIYYESPLKTEEISPGKVFKTIPYKAKLKLIKDANDEPFELIYNDVPVPYSIDEIECNETADVIIKQGEHRYVYSVRPSVKPLSAQFGRAYEQFQYEYENGDENSIERLQNGTLKLYAVEMSTEINDWSDVYSELETAFKAFKIICDKPNSHLKSVNEVRPIETVKRIGYESIPYLASHSEDWLARTASGLKPARLFSRVEEDDYQIYENRVVKTLIDQIINFLRKTEKQSRDKRDQLRSIINSNVQVDSFGFDVTFQKAVSELTRNSGLDDAYRIKNLEKIENLQKRAYSLLKKYRSLRKTRLYRYLKHSKKVLNPLNETNILLMDKHYNAIYKLWKTIHVAIAPREIEDEYSVAFDDLCDDYIQYCSTLIGYAAHVLNFNQISENVFERKADSIRIIIENIEGCMLKIVVKDIEHRFVEVPSHINVDLDSIKCVNGFYTEGSRIFWPNDVTVEGIDEFCKSLKGSGLKGKSLHEANQRYTAIKQLVYEKNISYEEPRKIKFIIAPLSVELESDSRLLIKNETEKIGKAIIQNHNVDFVIIGVPLCNEDEQKVVDYAKGQNSDVMILPLTLFDINSYRRLQNVLYRCIVRLDKEKCPNCGSEMRINDNQFVCNNCGQLLLTKTTCPHSDCQHEFYYLNYDVSSETIKKMKSINKDDFFQWDSLFQYKDIVEMTIEADKIKPICPICNRI